MASITFHDTRKRWVQARMIITVSSYLFYWRLPLPEVVMVAVQAYVLMRMDVLKGDWCCAHVLHDTTMPFRRHVKLRIATLPNGTLVHSPFRV